MLRLLRHYLPVRKALLIFSETLILWLVLAAACSAHLWNPSQQTFRTLLFDNLSPERAKLHCYVSTFLVAVLAQLAITFNELYDFRLSTSRYDRARRFVGSMGTAIALSVGAVVLAELAEIGRLLDLPGLSLFQMVQVLVFAMVVGFALLYGWRALYHELLRRLRLQERVLVIGSGKPAHVLAKEMRDHAVAGFEVVAILPEDEREAAVSAPAAIAATPFEPERVGTLELVLADAQLTDRGVERRPAASGPGEIVTLLSLAQELSIDVLAVAISDRRRKLPIDDLLRCRLAGVSVRDYESIFEQVAGKLAVEAMRPSYLIFNEGFARHPLAALGKRALDLVLSLVGLVLAFPIMVVTGIAVRRSSPGPMLFMQERVGLDGKPFTLLKFRSMVADAEKRTGPVWATEDDPRITKVGRFIRRARLDELPQLLNVLTGDMSLVGPRPERPVFVEELATKIPYFRQRHLVKPGLTGWAQINYPYGNTVEDALQKLQFDLFYIKYQSVLFDLSILFHTVKTILLRKGT